MVSLSHVNVYVTPGLKETTQDIVKKAQKEELTPWETYLQKRREKNRAKREQNTKASDTAVSHIPGCFQG